MKRLLAAVFTAFIISTSLFAQEHIKFKGRPVDGTAGSFKQFLRSSGFTESKSMDGWFEGTFAGMSDCHVALATLKNRDLVWKVIILSDTFKTWSSLESQYQSLKKSYTDKYGAPEVYEFFNSPYEEGDGLELHALENDKCTYYCAFTLPEGYVSIQLRSTRPGTGRVIISYEDKTNSDLFTAEKEAIVSDDI